MNDDAKTLQNLQIIDNFKQAILTKKILYNNYRDNTDNTLQNSLQNTLQKKENAPNLDFTPLLKQESLQQKKTQHSFPIYSNFKSFQNTYLLQSEAPQDTSQSSWFLENICMNKKGQFIYFKNSKISNLSKTLNFLLYSKNNFYNPLLSVQAWRRGIRGLLDLKFVDQELPILEMMEKNIPFLDDPVFITVRYAAGNIGHLLVDNFLPWYEVITKFGYHPNNVTLLFLDEINYRPCPSDGLDNFGYLQELCMEYQSSFLYNKTQTIINSLIWTNLFNGINKNNKIITKNGYRPILQRCSYQNIDKYSKKDIVNSLQFQIENAPCERDVNLFKNFKITKKEVDEFTNLDELQICFKKVMFGIGDRAIIPVPENSKFRELSLLGLRNLFLTNLGIDPNRQDPNFILQNSLQQNTQTLQNSLQKYHFKIGIHYKKKESRHGNIFKNINNIISKLENTLQNLQNNPLTSIFGHDILKNFKFTIIPIKLENLNPIQQIEIFSNLDIYISTIGSGSFYSLFMPKNSFLLYAPECGKFSILELRKTLRKMEKGILQPKYRMIYTEEEIEPNLKIKLPNYICQHPVIHFHTSLPINVIDISHTIYSCDFRKEIEPLWEKLKNLERKRMMVDKIRKRGEYIHLQKRKGILINKEHNVEENKENDLEMLEKLEREISYKFLTPNDETYVDPKIPCDLVIDLEGITNEVLHAISVKIMQFLNK
ncbi:hypothetical protein ABK040_009939 [Willaertia magna]